MKKKVLAAVILAMSLSVLAGCGNDKVDTEGPILPESQPIASTETQETVETQTLEQQTDANVITEREVVDGKMQSYLTGEWKDEDVVTRRNFAVMIPNNTPALPQYGISLASIVYEAPVEGNSFTRLMGIFEDYDELDRVGPVRSSRDYFLYESMAFDSIYCNWGLAVPYVGPVINTDQVDNISQAVAGIDSPSSEAFDRVSRPGYAKEFTGYMFIDGYKKAVDRHGYETEYTDRFVRGFTFADDCIYEYEDYPDATKIFPGGNTSGAGGYSSHQPCFAYNEDDHLYYRTQYGKAHVDEYNGEQIAVTNVVFKICHGEVRDDHGYLAFGVTGSGDAVVFTNGKVIEGTWERTGNYEPNVFYDENGEEIVFNQGKTWICCIWQENNYSSWE